MRSLTVPYEHPATARMFSIEGAFTYELRQSGAEFTGSLTPAPLAWVADILARSAGPWSMLNRVAFVGRAPGALEDLLPSTSLGRAAVLAATRDVGAFLRGADVRSAQLVDFRAKPPPKTVRLMANAKWSAEDAARAAALGSKLRATVVVESALRIEVKAESILQSLVERGVQMHAAKVLRKAGRRPARIGAMPDELLYRIARMDASMSFPSSGAVLEGDRLYLPFLSGGVETVAGRLGYNREKETWRLTS